MALDGCWHKRNSHHPCPNWVPLPFGISIQNNNALGRFFFFELALGRFSHIQQSQHRRWCLLELFISILGIGYGRLGPPKNANYLCSLSLITNVGQLTDLLRQDYHILSILPSMIKKRRQLTLCKGWVCKTLIHWLKISPLRTGWTKWAAWWMVRLYKVWTQI